MSRFRFFLWPTWRGNAYQLERRVRPSVHVGRCSHGTAWQLAVQARRWRWFIVLRDRNHDL